MGGSLLEKGAIHDVILQSKGWDEKSTMCLGLRDGILVRKGLTLKTRAMQILDQTLRGKKNSAENGREAAKEKKERTHCPLSLNNASRGRRGDSRGGGWVMEKKRNRDEGVGPGGCAGRS